MHDIESGLRSELKAISAEIESVNFKIENVASDEANLDAKIEKKKAELARHQKRLGNIIGTRKSVKNNLIRLFFCTAALKSVRPAFMDEFEKLEAELTEVYNTYVLKFRCLVFLEQQLEDVEKAESAQKLVSS